MRRRKINTGRGCVSRENNKVTLTRMFAANQLTASVDMAILYNLESKAVSAVNRKPKCVILNECNFMQLYEKVFVCNYTL